MRCCERCNKPTHTMTGSYFNTQMICTSCDTKERKHPDYDQAVRIETEQVLKGNLNYEGIGLPKELKNG